MIDASPQELEIIDDILARHVPGCEVRAFGSRVKWNAKDYSDLDLAVVGNSKLDRLVIADLKEAFAESDLRYRVDVLDWHAISASFRDAIEPECVVIREGKRSGWREVTLGECVVINDSTYSPKERWQYVNYLDTGNITENRILSVQQIDVRNDKLPTRARRKIRPGDVVYSTVRPNQRHYGVIDDPPLNFLVSTGFAVLRGKNGVANTEFIYWYLAQDHVVDYLHSIAENSTSAYPSIRPNDLRQLTLSLPPLPEQRRIAHILGTLDDKIELNRRMNETLEEMARAVFKDWFVDFGPVRAKMAGREPYLPDEVWGLFPDRLVASDLGEVPEGWGVRELGDHVSAVPGRSYRSSDLNESNTALVTLKSMKRGGGYSPDGLKSYTGRYKPEQEIQPGEVVVSHTDVTQAAEVIGRAARVGATRKYDTLVASLDLMVVRPGDCLNAPYLFHLLDSHDFHHHCLSYVNGTTVLHLNKQAVPAYRFWLPRKDLLAAFAANVEPLHALSDTNEARSDHLSEVRDELLPELLSGSMSSTDQVRR